MAVKCHPKSLLSICELIFAYYSQDSCGSIHSSHGIQKDSVTFTQLSVLKMEPGPQLARSGGGVLCGALGLYERSESNDLTGRMKGNWGLSSSQRDLKKEVVPLPQGAPA